MDSTPNMALPASFVDLSTAYNSAPDTFVNTIGVVVDLMPAKTVSSGQHMLTFKLLDPALRDAIWGTQGLPARFFRSDANSLPKVRQHGDVVLLRNIKMMPFNQQQMAISNHQTEVTVFPAASIPAPNFEIAYRGTQRLECLGVPLDVRKLSLQEQAYVIQLKHEMSGTLDSLSSSGMTNGRFVPEVPLLAPSAPAAMRRQRGEGLGTPTEATAARKRMGEELTAPMEAKKSRLSKKFKLVRELQHGGFADLCVRVVKKFPTKYGGCELYVTDHTENKDMFYYSPPEDEAEHERDGDRFSYTGAPKKAWPGPYGWLVLKVNVKDPHAHYANREVEEGDFVLLRNVKMKTLNRLEGDMWPDNLNPDQVQIRKLKDHETPEIKAVLERQERYWAKRRRKYPDAADEQHNGQKKKPTKTEQKKQKKQLAAEQAVKAVTTGLSKVDVNPHVRCSHEEVPISSIRDVLDPTNEMHATTTPDGKEYILPFMSVKYRARVRVVDFEPKGLESFALPGQLVSEKEPGSSPITDVDFSARHEWFFSLHLEDACKPKAAASEEYRLWVNVGHQDAQYLFGNDMEDPDDLKSDARSLAILREKLCILWGNLEERGADETISNRPFECCIAEYGVEMDEDDPSKSESWFGFKRMYRMFGVTIS